MFNAPDIVVVGVFGLALGSLATAMAYRLPRDLSMFTRVRSRCPSCNHALGPLDLVPLFSWIFLRGKCRYCRAPIGWQYPVIELATLSLCLLFYAFHGFAPELLPLFALAPVLVAIIDIDFRYGIIPDGLNLSIFLLGVAALLANALVSSEQISFLTENGALAAGGCLAYGLGSLALRQGGQLILKREPMGLGDIKFFAAAGVWLGLSAEAAAAFMMISGLCGTIMALVWKKVTGEAEVPFGPSLIVAFIAVLCLFPAVAVISPDYGH